MDQHNRFQDRASTRAQSMTVLVGARDEERGRATQRALRDEGADAYLSSSASPTPSRVQRRPNASNLSTATLTSWRLANGTPTGQPLTARA
jgi:hypothetical protein